jgi:hypothetical protein
MWRPLLADEARGRALAVVEEITRSLPDPPGNGEPESGGWSLAGGSAGLAVLAAYLSRSLGEPYDDAAVGFLNHATRTVSGISLYGGVAGVAWALEHTHDQLFPRDPDDPNEIVDDRLIEVLSEPWNSDYDLIGGLVGIGVYAVERLPHASGGQLLSTVVDRLDEIAERTDRGITWASRREWMSPEV